LEDMRQGASPTGEGIFASSRYEPERPPACVSISTAFGELLLDLGRFRPLVNDRLIQLTRVEFDILAHVVRNAHRVVTYEELFAEVIRAAHQPGTSLLRVHLTHLRRKLGALGQAIETVRGRGLAIRKVVASQATISR
jgi:DNA-binding response OmpR family regulator